MKERLFNGMWSMPLNNRKQFGPSGQDGLTTRAVCEAAGVRAPTLYHHFGDKGGLERALIQRGMAEFMERKRAPPPSLVLQGVSRKDIEAVSDLLFEAVVDKLSQAAS